MAVFYISHYNCYATSCQKICPISSSCQITASAVLYCHFPLFPIIILTKPVVRWALSCLCNTVFFKISSKLSHTLAILSIFETDCHRSAHCRSEFGRMLKTCNFLPACYVTVETVEVTKLPSSKILICWLHNTKKWKCLRKWLKSY